MIRRLWWLCGLGLAGIFLLVFWAYFPATQHPPREDQWPFLLDTIDEDHVVPLIQQTYSYNRSRKIGPGDYLLFRPVLFTLLSAEKALFGARYQFWHLAGITIHCAIVGVFLSLLLRLGQIYPAASPAETGLREFLAYFLALFFAVNFAGTEMVIWCHIQGYMIYVLCVLGALRLLVDDVCGVDPLAYGKWRLAAALVVLFVGAFAYEVGSLLALCFAVVLGLSSAWRGQIRRGVLRFALFASLLPLFVISERLDRLAHPEAKPDITEASVLEHATWEQTAQNSGRYLLFTLWQPFFPTSVEWEFEDRIVIPEPSQNPEAYWRPGPFLLVSYGVVLVGTGLALLAIRRILSNRLAQRGFLFLFIPGSLILLHLAIIVMGRLNIRAGPMTLAQNSYYAYTPLLAFLMGLYFIWVRGIRWPSPRLPRSEPVFSVSGYRFLDFSSVVASVLIIAGLGVLSLCSAAKIHGMTRHIRAYYRPLRTEIAAIQELIDEHEQEPNFAISFDPDTYYSLPYYHGLPRVYILFARFVDHEHPTHVIGGDAGKLVVMREEEYRRDHGRHYQRLPKFIQSGRNDFMVFRYQDRYYGLHFDEGCFRTERDDYRHLLEGNSVADVLRQIPEAVRRIDEESNYPQGSCDPP
jgi:hypothetical protein